MPSNACLPLAASGPVNAMLKPTLIGSWLCALAETVSIVPAASVIAAPAIQAKVRDLSLLSILVLPIDVVFLHLMRIPAAKARGKPAHDPVRRVGYIPSTITVSTSPAPPRRNAAARSYSGDVKQATPCSSVGNSIT